MASSKKQQFIRDAEQIAFNEQHRKTIQFNMGKYHTAVGLGKLRYANLDAARTKASEIKRHTLAHLPEYLEEFERNFTKNGGTVCGLTRQMMLYDILLKFYKTCSSFYCKK